MAENAKHLLLVDDEAGWREAMAERLADHGFVVEQAGSGEEALNRLATFALEQRRLRSENAYLRSQLEQRYRINGLVGRSRVMRDLFHLLETVAATSSTVLISGETGTGK